MHGSLDRKLGKFLRFLSWGIGAMIVAATAGMLFCAVLYGLVRIVSLAWHG